MQISASDNEMLAFIALKKMLQNAGTPVPQFLHWVADRLTKKFGDEEQVDFVQALRQRARELYEISVLLEVNRGPERLP